MSETYKINSTTGNLDKIGQSTSDITSNDARYLTLIIQATAPDGVEGLRYINSTDHTLYVFYQGTWQSTGVVFTPVTIAAGNPFGLWLPFWRTYAE